MDDLALILDGLFIDLFALMVIFFSCLVIRSLLITIGQTWISTFTHTATFLILPIVTFVITKVISGNIALSLGMVGALSIIRFRNPVKSPFELVIYFLAITMGIAAGVSLKWSFILPGLIIAVLIGITLMDYFMNSVYKRNFFQASFTEGNELSLLEIRSNSKLDELIKDNNLIASIEDGENFSYTFASSNKDILVNIKEKYSEDERIISFNLKI